MQINFAIFGEQNNGHGLLATSGNKALASKLTPLTDRPGDPPVGADWGPIFSGFPFAGHYIFLKIQPDATVQRAGMVRSFAACVPISEINAVNDISLIYSKLPSDLGPPPSALEPLAVSDDDLAKAPSIGRAQGRLAVARLLTAPDTKLPLLWTSPEPYLPTIANLWAQLPPGLREHFSFHFLFAPEHHTIAPPTIVATLPEFRGRWATAHVIDPHAVLAEPLTSPQEWLAGSSDRKRFEQSLRDFAIELPQFEKLSVIMGFVELIDRLGELTFMEARKAVYIAAQYSRKTEESESKRAQLFDRFCTLTRSVSIVELLKLRNFENRRIPELVPNLQRSMALAIAAQNLVEAGPCELEAFEAAVGEPNNWWSVPFVNWLKAISDNLNKEHVGRLFAISGSPAVLSAVFRGLAATNEHETFLLENLPKEFSPKLAENLATTASSRSWWRLHAACLTRFMAPADAIAQHVAAGTSEESIDILERASGLGALVSAACASGNPTLITYVGKKIAQDTSTYLSLISTSCPHRLRVLRSVVTSGKGPLSGDLRSVVLQSLEDYQVMDAKLADLCHSAVARDGSLLLEVPSPAELVARMPKDIGQEVDLAFEHWLRMELQAAHPLTIVFGEAFKTWFGARPVVEWLNAVPAATAVRAGLNCFRSLPFLTDADCGKWLVSLFTRTSRERLSSADAFSLAEFLAAVDFPTSATIVRDTAIDFKRNDVLPIHEQIRYKYQMAGVFARKSTSGSNQCYPVLIVTALPLERAAVIEHLPAATYDSSLFADVSSWPSHNPVYEIYHITSGQGNLAVQSAVHRFLKHGIIPDLAFFSGVCGGVKDSEVGDVVFSTKVYYTEGGKEEDDGVKARPAIKETNEDLVQLAIRVSDTRWQPADHGMPRPPKSSPAVLAAGEQVLASTKSTAESYQRLKKSYNDTQAVDMEAYGFLKATQDEGIKFSMVLRGVSDKLENKGESDAKGSQPLAARNVAAFLFALLPACRPLLEPPKKAKRGFLGSLFNS